MKLERGLKVDHCTIYRWVQKYAPELDKRCRPQLKPTNDSYRVDETYIIVEQDHRFIKRRVAPALGFASFHTAARTLRGYEAMNMIRKEQIEGVEKEDIAGQVNFIENLFGIAA